MNLNKFTLKSQEAIQTAQEIANSYNNQSIEPEHLFASLIQDSDGLIQDILKKLGAPMEVLKIKTNALIEKLPKVSGLTAQVYISNDTNIILNNALKEADNLKDEYISTEHLLIALCLQKSGVHNLLIENNIDKNKILKALKDIRGNKNVTDQNPEDKYNVIKKFGRNLNDAARKGKIDPVIGRDQEIRRVLQVLARRTKNNPILIGEPGVGKTAIVEGIALRIVSGDIPENLKNRQLISLDMGTLVAGTSYRGQFEERLKEIVKEVTESDGEIILFIDEIHTLIGAGATSGAMDAANILKPALARGELRMIGATTLDEYQKHIEKDAGTCEGAWQLS